MSCYSANPAINVQPEPDTTRKVSEADLDQRQAEKDPLYWAMVNDGLIVHPDPEGEEP